MRKLSYLLVVTLMLVIGCSPVVDAGNALVGKPAPAFTLTDSNGKKHNLADFKGKFVVLEWVNYDCPFVRKHYNSGNMQSLQKAYTEKGIVWLSVNSSAAGKQGNFAPEKINTLIKEKGAQPSAYLIDSDGQVGRLYGARTTPHMYIINPQGELIYNGAIDDKPSADPADIGTAKNFVRTALDEALAGKPVTTSATQPYGCSVKY